MMSTGQKQTRNLEVGDLIIWQDEAVEVEGQPAVVTGGRSCVPFRCQRRRLPGQRNHQEAEKNTEQGKLSSSETVSVRKDDLNKVYESWMQLAHIVESMDQEKHFDLYELLEPIKRHLGNVMIGGWAGLVEGGRPMKPKKEKELTLEMSLEERKEIREIWCDVCAFHQALNGLDESEDTHFTLRQLHDGADGKQYANLPGKPH